MALLPTLGALAFAGLAIPVHRRWRRFAYQGARLQAHHEAIRFVLVVAAAVVLVLMATGRLA